MLFSGGIIRPVIVTELPSAKYWIDRVEPITTDIINGLITVNVVIAGPEIPPSVHVRSVLQYVCVCATVYLCAFAHLRAGTLW